MKEKQRQQYFFLVLLTIIFVLTYFIFRPFIGSLVLGVTFAVVFYPFYEVLVHAFKKESIASFITSATVVLVIFTPFILFGVLMFREAQDIYEQLGGSSVSITQRLEPYTLDPIIGRIPQGAIQNENYSRQIIGWVAQNLGSAFSSVARVIVTSLLSLLALYYFLKDGKDLVKQITQYSPLPDKHDKAILLRLHTAINSVVKGYLSIAVLQGFSSSIGFALFGVPHAALWGGVAAVSALIPSVGTSLVIVPAIIYLFFAESMTAAIGLVIWGVLAVGLIDNLLAPKLIERGLKIHPLIILLSVIGGISAFGPIGFLMGPLTLSFLFALLEIYQVVIADKKVKT